MTEQEIKDGNKLIAVFMGASIKVTQDPFYEEKPPSTWIIFDSHPNHIIKNVGRTFSDYDLKYDLQWDWLIPVVEKIEKINELGNSTRINYDTLEEIHFCDIVDLGNLQLGMGTSKSKIEAVWLAVVDCIEYYNTLKQK